MTKTSRPLTVLLTLALSLVAASFSQADVAFDFTAGEGFTGEPSAPLNGQQDWAATGGILVNVDPTKEFLFVDGGSGQNAQYNGQTFNSQDGVLSFTQEFRFIYNGEASGDLYNVFRLDSDDTAQISRVYVHYANGNFRVRYSTGNGWDRNMRSSRNIEPSEIGIEIGTDNSSDLLRLRWDLKRGETPSGWLFKVILENVDTGTTVLKWNVSDVVVRDIFHDDTSIVSGFSQTNRLGGVYVESYSVAVLPDPGFWFLANDEGDDLLSLGWLGYFFVYSTEFYGYMYHLQHGWQYYVGGNIDNFWPYDFALNQWAFFGSFYYPWIYVYGEGERSGWNYFLVGTVGSRVYYNANSDSNWSE
jgi:hypothetical protein